MKAAELRQSILQAAVQGKLVSQNPHDEPASELLKRIHMEKTQLVKEGEFKKDKPLTPINEDEIPFDLPEGWTWVYLGEILYYTDAGKSPDCIARPAGFNEYGVIKTTAIQIDQFLANENKVLPKGFALNNEMIIHNSDILITRAGPLNRTGRVCLVDGVEVENLILSDKTVRLNLSNDLLYKPYVVLALNSPVVRYSMESKMTGMAESQVNIAQGNMKFFIFPLPPLSEQRRIVAKAKELLKLCDDLGKAEKMLNDLEARFAEYLPKSILQMAVQGKLVPQNVHDEPASELLKRIQKEKARLVKEGKIKKEKPLPPIAEDEIPYDLPDGWVWCRLGDIVFLTRGITFPASDKSKEMKKGFVRCATTGSVQKEYNPNSDVFVPEMYVKNSGQWLQKNDIIMSSANSKELVGKSCLWHGNLKMAFGGFLTVIRTTTSMNLMFLYYGLQFLQKSGVFSSYSTQTTNIANLNNDMILNTLLPLPPYNEQQRIFTKVEELMALCVQLRSEGNRSSASNVSPFSQIDEQYEIGLAARGDGSLGLSEQAQRDVDELLKR